MKLDALITKLRQTRWVPEIVAILGGLVFFQRLWHFAHRLPSVIDEGMYLHKGFLFVSGRYLPYQDFGPWTDHMPFSFLIPGYTQLLFGLGIRTGRYYAVGLAMLLLLGVWIISKRLGGKWWAGLAVWVFALNPVLAQMYSAAASQVLAATLLVWVLVFGLGKDRPSWQLLLSISLATVLFLSRINMLPVPVLLLLYFYFQHGRKSAVYAAIVSAVIVLTVHLAFWPDILKMWAEVIPSEMLPFLEPFAMPESGAKAYEPDFTFNSRIVSFFSGVRFHFVSIVGFILALLSWKSIREHEKKDHFIDFTFVIILYTILISTHATASVVLSYCVSCFPNYMGFFSALGVILLIYSAPHLFTRTHQIKPWLAYILILLLFVGILFGAKGGLLPRMISFLTTLVRRLPIPAGRFSFAVGAVIAAASFVLILALIILIARWLQPRLEGRGRIESGNFGSLLLITFLVIGWLLSPTYVFSEGHRGDLCGGDVITSFEEIGDHLSTVIPPGSQVYWRVSTPVPLLSIPDVELFPSQLSGAYSMRIGGNPEELEPYGFWNDAMGAHWIQDTDYYLTDQVQEGFPSEISPEDFTEIESTPSGLNCRPGVSIRIFKRN